ncbi:glycoside hydrolase family 32 protein [Novosphingobium sp.]|uniref:glycoside hydrolase family 32 protein n=1 Tax=Novosphingobium sp. TaxID=1874826 RepID=UPI0035AD9D3C
MRPQYHYAPAANWLSDPNGLVHHQGEWHLFYQYNPHGEDWGHMSWGHAISTDLRHWQELPPALLEDERHAIFSGSAVVDHANTAGLGEEALVALYTGAVVHGDPHQVQCLAWSGDRGRSWTKYAGNPVIDRAMADFRDPNVFWHAATQRWIMVVVLSNENRALIYASHDLRQWDELSVIHGAGAPGEVWECPLLIELPVEGTDETRWLFKVDALRGAPGSGALYQTGTFDGVRFHPDGPALEPWWQVADMGSDFYAAIAWHEPRDAAGRPLWIGWMGNHAYQGRLPRQGWRGAMSLPRRLSLVRAGERHVLRQIVDPAAVSGVPLAEADTALVPLACCLRLPGASRFAATLTDAEGRLLVVERRDDQLTLTRRDPASPFLDAVRHARVDGDGPLDLWLDAGSAELLGDDGRLSVTVQHRMAGDRLALRCLTGAALAA